MTASLTAAPPVLDDAAAARLGWLHFGLTGPLTRLTSERDLNIRLTAAEGDFVLKLSNPAEAPEVTRLQSQALLHLERTVPDLPVPRLRRTLTGDADVVLPGGGLLRCLSYLSGTPQHQTARSRQQGAALGQMAARLTQGLHGFSHPAAGHELQWDIRHTARLRPLLAQIGDPALRALASATLQRFEHSVLPHLPDCRWQIVHNDLNPHNVLVFPAAPDRIAGILDFGDMVETPLVCDLAVAASYQIDPDHPLRSLTGFVQAYEAVLPLTGLERPLIPALTAARMLTTVAIASWRASLYPDNAPYILRNVPQARAGLAAIAAIPRADLSAAFGPETP